MRTLRKEASTVYISSKLYETEQTDEKGYLTGEYITTYSVPTEILIDIKSSSDELDLREFGETIKNIKKSCHTFCDVNNLRIKDGDIAWVGVKPNGVLTDVDHCSTEYVSKSDVLNGGNFIDYTSGDTAYGGNFTDYSSGDNYNGGTFGTSMNYNYKVVKVIETLYQATVYFEKVVVEK